MDTQPRSYPVKYVLSRYTLLGGCIGGLGSCLFMALALKDVGLLGGIFSFAVYGIFIGIIPSFAAGALLAAFRVYRGVKGTLASLAAFILPEAILLFLYWGSNTETVFYDTMVFSIFIIGYILPAIFAGIVLSFLLPKAEQNPPQTQDRS